MFVPPPSTSSTSISAGPQNSKSTTLPTSTSEAVIAPTSLPINTHPMQTRSKSGIHNPKLHSSLFLTHSKPKIVKQALASHDWLSANQQEYDALMKNNTWNLLPLPSNRQAIGCKWVYVQGKGKC